MCCCRMYQKKMLLRFLRYTTWWKRLWWRSRLFRILHYGEIRYREGYMDGFDAAYKEIEL